ncbi:MAG: GTPase [Candidatus Micrarchaeota archaeon]|nr:GTPase [Candidatus Micrarchaeota archaeon]
MTKRANVLILGAAGRDYHNFNMVFRDRKEYNVVGFTHAQLPTEAKIYPAKLAGKLYPKGIQIYDEREMERIIHQKQVDIVCLSYSDLSHHAVMHLASRALACGASFMLLGPAATQLSPKKPVIAVCAVRTGAGKSPLTEHISLLLKRSGKKVGIIRHPMPYGDLVSQEVQRFASLEDLDRNKCTLEEREDYERHIRNGFTVYAGVDYAKVLALAERENDIIIWDGGNNDFPFIRPDLMITVADAMRAGHEVGYHPGETNFRMCDIIAVNKWEKSPKGAQAIERNAKDANPRAMVVKVSMEHKVEGKLRKGMRVVVVEDGPTITHGEMPYGIGKIAAEAAGCSVVDASKSAKGIYEKIYREYPHIQGVIPAVGYSERQLRDLEATVNAARADAVVLATPTDLTKLLRINKPAVKVSYRMQPCPAIDRMVQALL